MIYINQIFKNETLIELFSDDTKKLGLKFFILYKLVNSTNVLWNYCILDFIRYGSKHNIRNIEYDPNAVIIFFIEIEQIEPKQMIKSLNEHFKANLSNLESATMHKSLIQVSNNLLNFH